MKYIKKINPIELTNLHNIPFKDSDEAPIILKLESFILQRLSDPKFGSSVDNLISATQIKKAVEKSEEFIELETKDWELLVSVVKHPDQSIQYNTNIAHCLVPIIQTILEATDDLKK